MDYTNGVKQALIVGATATLTTYAVTSKIANNLYNKFPAVKEIIVYVLPNGERTHGLQLDVFVNVSAIYMLFSSLDHYFNVNPEREKEEAQGFGHIVKPILLGISSLLIVSLRMAYANGFSVPELDTVFRALKQTVGAIVGTYACIALRDQALTPVYQKVCDKADATWAALSNFRGPSAKDQEIAALKSQVKELKKNRDKHCLMLTLMAQGAYLHANNIIMYSGGDISQKQFLNINDLILQQQPVKEEDSYNNNNNNL